jgi:hypothetical protein
MMMGIFWGFYDNSTIFRRRGLCCVYCAALCFIFLEYATMTTTELERAAYVAGDIDRAGLLARIDDLTEALGRAVAEIETLRDERDALAAEVAE